MNANPGVLQNTKINNFSNRFDQIKRSYGSCSGTKGSDEPNDFTDERLRVAGLWRSAICDALDDADADDFVGDGVTARVLLRRRRGGKPASLIVVDGIGRAGDFVTALMLNTEVDWPVDAVNGMLRFAPSCVSYAGYCARFTGVVSADVSFRCAFDAVELPG